jgi:hypothetical protein
MKQYVSTLWKALAFNNDSCQYGMTLGTNFHAKIEIKFDYDTSHIQWCDSSLPMHTCKGLISANLVP